MSAHNKAMVIDGSKQEQNRTRCVEVPFEVQKHQHGLRVDSYLTARLHRYSRAQVQRLIAEGRVFLRRATRTILKQSSLGMISENRFVAKASSRITNGDTVLVRYPWREDPPALHATLPVLHEDDDLLVINKPSDVLSHPTDRVVANTVTSILRQQFPGQTLHLVHRLDRETSGILILAKTPQAARNLTKQFTERRIHKEYLALVRGRIGFKSKTVTLDLSRENGEIKVRQTICVNSSPKSSVYGHTQHIAIDEATESTTNLDIRQNTVTEFHRIAANDRFSLVRAIPKTGRLHQIRVHLAAIGHPIIGDKLYTGNGEAYLKAVRRELREEDIQALGADRQMLHARRMKFVHPKTGCILQLFAPPPADFIDRLTKLGGNIRQTRAMIQFVQGSTGPAGGSS